MAWRDAGRPRYRRSPYTHLICPEMYRFFTNPRLLDVAEALLGTSEISVHGIFNGRPKLPEQDWTTTPWHQDAQEYRMLGEQNPEKAQAIDIVTMWIPLQDCRTGENGCLEIASLRETGGVIFPDGHMDPKTDHIMIPKPYQERLTPIAVEMDAGDVLCFTQKTPHRAQDNHTDTIRWSLDVRYVATEQAIECGRRFGFVARSRKMPETVTPVDAWIAKRMSAKDYEQDSSTKYGWVTPATKSRTEVD